MDTYTVSEDDGDVRVCVAPDSSIFEERGDNVGVGIVVVTESIPTGIRTKTIAHLHCCSLTHINARVIVRDLLSAIGASVDVPM